MGGISQERRAEYEQELLDAGARTVRFLDLEHGDETGIIVTVGDLFELKPWRVARRTAKFDNHRSMIDSLKDAIKWRLGTPDWFERLNSAEDDYTDGLNVDRKMRELLGDFDRVRSHFVIHDHGPVLHVITERGGRSRAWAINVDKNFGLTHLETGAARLRDWFEREEANERKSA